MTEPPLPTPPSEPTPRMTPTRPGTLALAALVACVVGWTLGRRFYGDIPRMTWFPAITLVLLAVTEGLAARTTWARIARRPGTLPVEPLVVARFAALAKASSLGGALVGGAYAGLLLWEIGQRDRLAAAAADVAETAGAVVGSLLLVAAALWLERACRIPKRPES